MRFLLLSLLTVLTLAQCATKRTASDNSAPELTLTYSHTETVGEALQLYFTLKNHLPDTVVILRPYPARPESNFVPSAVPPDFFRLTLFPREALCEYAPMNSGTTAVKQPEDFMFIEPDGERTFRVDPDHYFQGICNEEVGSVRGVLRYEFDSRFVDDEDFYNARIKRPKRLSEADSERLLELLRRSYRQEIVTDTFTVIW